MELSLFDGDESVDSGRRCASCGEPFTMYANGAGTKYCSTACKREGYTRAARSPGPPPPSVICPICDIKFSRNVGRGGYKYCSPECRRESAKTWASRRVVRLVWQARASRGQQWREHEGAMGVALRLSGLSGAVAERPASAPHAPCECREGTDPAHESRL